MTPSVDNSVYWRQALKVPIELGTETPSTIFANFSTLFPSFDVNGFPDFNTTILGSVTNCTKQPLTASSTLYDEATSMPCGGTPDSLSGDGNGDFLIGVGWILLTSTATNVTLRMGSPRVNEGHLVAGVPGVYSGWLTGGTLMGTNSFTAVVRNLTGLPTTCDGQKIVEFRVYL